MLCPKCRTRTPVDETMRDDEPMEPITIRIYSCPNPECGARWKTDERLKGYLPPSRKTGGPIVDVRFDASREKIVP
jgi:hypothetical protein